ncbi:MAG: hypothetical protein U5N85_15120 [Arcicella sp.]|nr:hypothetical protein [Arcicella sp.]
MSQTLKYFCHNETQAEAFLQKIESLAPFSDYFNGLSDEITARQKWKKFAEFLIEVKKVSISTEAMYNIFLKSEEKRYKTQKDVTTISILPFLNEFLPEVFEESYDGRYGSFSNKKIESSENSEEFNEACNVICKDDWLLYTFGEKTVMESIGSTGNKKQKRIYYIKERPVRFDKLSENGKDKFCRIRIKNIDILSNQDKNINLYDGKCHFYTKVKDRKNLYYLETKMMDSDDKNDRRLRISLCFGELKFIEQELENNHGVVEKKKNYHFGEFGIGIFSGLRDGGAFFSGAAI